MWNLKKFIARFPKPVPTTRWEVLRLFFFGFMLGSIIFSAIFIYQHIFQTLNEANSVVVLSSSSALDPLNLDGFKKTQAIVAEKQATSTLPSNLRQIFRYETSTPTN